MFACVVIVCASDCDCVCMWYVCVCCVCMWHWLGLCLCACFMFVHVLSMCVVFACGSCENHVRDYCVQCSIRMGLHQFDPLRWCVCVDGYRRSSTGSAGHKRGIGGRYYGEGWRAPPGASCVVNVHVLCLVLCTYMYCVCYARTCAVCVLCTYMYCVWYASTCTVCGMQAHAFCVVIRIQSQVSILVSQQVA